MRKKTLRTLEYDKIISMLSGFAASSMAKEKINRLEPSDNIMNIAADQRETSEAVGMIMQKGSLKLGALKDIRSYLHRASIGGVLNPAELLDAANFLYVCRMAKEYSVEDNKKQHFEILRPQFDIIVCIDALEREINRCILSAEEIADNASSRLNDIRRGIRASNESIKDKLNGIIHSQSYKNMLQDPVITIRNDRYCVPIKSEYKSSFQGMIHDQSATGATFFIEPLAVVTLNNKIKELQAEEKTEIQKILKALTEKIYEYSDVLKNNIQILTHLDFVFAKAELSISMNAVEPRFNTNGFVNLKKARHPLIEHKKVVPIDINIGGEFNTLLITGPNTGGKTVSLKTLGLFTLMGQSGLHIPALDNSELCVFDNVFADIGDEQSIEQSLSTFSSHMSNIVEILSEVTDNSLVLLDELGAGTDPTEGAALAIAVIERLHSRKIRTAVTTHYSELKVFAISTDGVENASCEFDVVSLRPTYKLLIGVPGKSNAFAISQRLGLDEDIIQNAKAFLSHEDAKFEDVITDLEISRKSLEEEREQIQAYRREAERLKTELEAQRKKTAQRREKIILKANEEAKALLIQAKEDADSIVKEVQRLARENSSQKELDQKRNELKGKIEASDKKLSKLSKPQQVRMVNSEKLKKGDRVYITSLRQSGTLESLPNQKGEVMVKAGIMNVRVSVKELSYDVSVQEKKAPEKPRYTSGVKSGKAKNIRSEIDLRGSMALEAIEKVDKYLDDAYLAGMSPITIIHGKGTGALRSAIHEFLRKNSHVKSYRLGEYGEGEAGVTIVELK